MLGRHGAKRYHDRLLEQKQCSRQRPQAAAESESSVTVIERDVFQAKYGRGDDLVQLFQGARAVFADYGRSDYRILTDLAGEFFTVVVEFEWESLSQMEAERDATFADPRFQEWFSKMPELVESGRRELFTVVA